MRRKLLLGLALMLFVAALAAGCSLTAGSEDSTITGIVHSKDNGHILVVEGIEEAGVPQEEWQGNRAIYFTLKEKTIIEKDGKKVSPEELTAGSKVEVWADGPIAESYPEQAAAGRIVVLSFGSDGGTAREEEE